MAVQQFELRLDSQIVFAQFFLRNRIKPKILEYITKTTGIKEGRIDIESTFQGLDWEIKITREYDLSIRGELPVLHSEKIIGGEVTFQIIFIPEKFAPESGRIKIGWDHGAITLDGGYIKSLLEKFICPKCDGIRGTTCECEPKLETINLGEAIRSLEAIKQDALSVLVSMKLGKQKSEEIVNHVATKFPGLLTFDKFIKECFKIYQTYH